LFKRALEQQQSPQIAFELAKILASEGYLTESLVYFSKAIEIGNSLGYDVGGEKQAEYHMHRSLTYEALGLKELASRDLIKITECDPEFKIKYSIEADNLRNSGKNNEAFQIT